MLFTYASATHVLVLALRPRPHTYRPTLTPIQLVRRKPSFTDRTSEITLRYHRRGLVDRFFLEGPTVDFSNRIPTSICLINCHNSNLVCRAPDPYPPASTTSLVPGAKTVVELSSSAAATLTAPPLPLPVMPATAPRPQ